MKIKAHCYVSDKAAFETMKAKFEECAYPCKLAFSDYICPDENDCWADVNDCWVNIVFESKAHSLNFLFALFVDFAVFAAKSRLPKVWFDSIVEEC